MSSTAESMASVLLPARLEALLGPPETRPEPLGGGVTHHALRVRYGGRDVVVRLAADEAALLGIDRDCERRATASAAAAGVGPAVVAFLRDPECLVTAFIPGRTLARSDLGRPDMIAEAAVALWEVHGGPPIPNRFSPWDVVDHYAATAAARGASAPGAFGDLREGARRIRMALDPAHAEHAPVPCHNHLVHANLIHDGERVRIVDWAYAGMGNRYFDLSSVSVGNGLDESGDEWLLECYWGEPCTRRRLATVRLMRVMSDFRAAMWGVVQTTISETGLDFPAYAEEHFERARAGFADPRFAVWLEDARGP
jgi:thiamine kinase-like enzyme